MNRFFTNNLFNTIAITLGLMIAQPAVAAGNQSGDLALKTHSGCSAKYSAQVDRKIIQSDIEGARKILIERCDQSADTYASIATLSIDLEDWQAAVDNAAIASFADRHTISDEEVAVMAEYAASVTLSYIGSNIETIPQSVLVEQANLAFNLLNVAIELRPQIDYNYANLSLLNMLAGDFARAEATARQAAQTLGDESFTVLAEQIKAFSEDKTEEVPNFDKWLVE